MSFTRFGFLLDFFLISLTCYQWVRVELHNQDRTIGKKIRELSKRKIPLIAIVGKQEAMNQKLNLRCLGIPKQQEMSLAELEHKLADLSLPF